MKTPQERARVMHKSQRQTAAGAADTHNSGDSEVEVSRFFGDYLTRATVKKRHSENGGGKQIVKKCSHYLFSPFSRDLRNLRR